MLFFTVTFFLISPISSIPFSLFGMIFLKKESKMHLFIFALAIAMISLHLQPLITDDGTDVLNRISVYSYLSFNQLLDIDKFYREPLTHLLYFLISKTADHKLIFAISGFIQFYLLLYVVIDYANRIHAKKTARLQAILLVLCYHTFFPVIASFRYYTAMAICFFAWYILTIKDKRVTAIVLSFVACLIHSSYYMQLVVLLITLIFWKRGKSKSSKWFKVGLVAWSIMSGILATWLSNFSSYLFQNSSDKLMTYGVIKGIGDLNRGYISLLIDICGLAMCILFIYMAYKKNRDKTVIIERENAQRYYDLLSNYMFFSIGSFIYLGIFIRLQQMAVTAAVIPILMYSLQKQRDTVSVFIQNVIITLAILTGCIYSFHIVPPHFDISIGRLIVENIFVYLLNLL